MAQLPVLPKAQAAIAVEDRTTRQLWPAGAWYDFFRQLRQFVSDNEGNTAQIDAILARLDALEAETQVDALFLGIDSVQVFGTMAGGLVQITLQGDEDQPGQQFYYGTGPTGEKGFFPAASLVMFMVDENGDFLVDENGDFLISQDITADLFAIVNTGYGMLAHTGNGTWEERTFQAGAGLTGSNLDGISGNPSYAHADTSSVADVSINNSGGVVLQDVTSTYDTFGHVLTTTFASVDLDGRYLQATSVGNGLKIVSQVLSVGESGTEDSSTFLRGDGIWTNTLLGEMNITLDGSGIGLVGTRYSGDTTGPQWRSLKARGSLGTPAAVNALDIFFNIQGRGYTSAGAFSGNVVDLRGYAIEGFTSTQQGTAAEIRTTSIASTTMVSRLQVSPIGGGELFVANATTVPATNPTGGGYLYAEGGAGKWRGSSGTVTTFGPANPHCPECGTDFVHEWDNAERYGYLAVCMNCFAQGRNSHTRVRGAWNVKE